MSYIGSRYDEIMSFVDYVQERAFRLEATRLSEVRKWATMTGNILEYVESLETAKKR